MEIYSIRFRLKDQPGNLFVRILPHSAIDAPSLPPHANHLSIGKYYEIFGLANCKIPFDLQNFHKLEDGNFSVDFLISSVLANADTLDILCPRKPKNIPEYSFFKFVGLNTTRYLDIEINVDDSTVVVVKNSLSMKEQEILKNSLFSKNSMSSSQQYTSDSNSYQKSEIIKKGFLNSKNVAGSLYGTKGSLEGCLPENAGDPMGWLPVRLRKFVVNGPAVETETSNILQEYSLMNFSWNLIDDQRCILLKILMGERNYDLSTLKVGVSSVIFENQIIKFPDGFSLDEQRLLGRAKYLKSKRCLEINIPVVSN